MRIEATLRALTRSIAPAVRPRRRIGDAQHVHFHQGPQGQPAACHDPGCASPQLDV